MLLPTADVQELCQVMFKAFCSLVSTHPTHACTCGLVTGMRLGWGLLQSSWQACWPCCCP